MKYLLVLVVLLVAFWIWRNNRQQHQRSQHPQAGTPTRATAMIACDQCGTHLPESELIKGSQGRYCCAEHRSQHERSSH